MVCMAKKRSERYPVVGMALSPDRIATLRAYAEEYSYRDRRGVLPGALAKDLFERSWANFAEIDFDPHRLPKPEPEKVRRLKDWFYALYCHLPPDSRWDIFRGLADRYNFELPPGAESEREPRRTEEEDQTRRMRAGPKRGH